MKSILASLLLSFSACGADIEGFFRALAKVESSGNPRAVNKKEYALGIYQIRRAYWIDSGVGGKHEDVFNPIIAKKVCLAYFKRYAPQALKDGDWETLARCHNSGGLNYKKKHLTDAYWAKIQQHLR